jgi:hypothetical protein
MLVLVAKRVDLQTIVEDVYSEPKPYCLVSDHPQAELLDQTTKKQRQWDMTVSESSGAQGSADKPPGISEQVRAPSISKVDVSRNSVICRCSTAFPCCFV